MGKKAELPLVDKFLSLVKDTRTSVNAKRLFKAIVKEHARYPSAVRWWSTYELIKQVAWNFVEVKKWASKLIEEEYCSATARKMQKILNDPHDGVSLQLQLAAAIDAFDIFVRATYKVTAGLDVVTHVDSPS